MTYRSYARVAALVAGVLVALTACVTRPRDSRLAEEREHAAAWGSHHLCAGLFVVGRDHQREPDVVVANDIARFPAFRWEESFEYDVDLENRRVTRLRHP
jgi:hypothetical protein